MKSDWRAARRTKLQLRDRVQAVVLAYQAGLADPGPSPHRPGCG